MRRELTRLRAYARMAVVLSLAAGAGAACRKTAAPSNNGQAAVNVAPTTPTPDPTKPADPANTGGVATNATTSVATNSANSVALPPPPRPAAEPPPVAVRRISGPPADQKTALNEINEMFTAAAQRRGEIEALHLRVVVRTTNTQVKQTDVNTAEVRYRGSADPAQPSVYVHAGGPSELFISVRGDDVVTYRPKINEVLRAKRSAAQDGPAQLKELLEYGKQLGYRSAAAADTGDTADEASMKERRVLGTYRVGRKRATLVEEVTKKGQRTHKMKVWVDQQTGLALRIERVEKDTSQVFDIVETVINPRATPDEFKLSVPTNAREVKR